MFTTADVPIALIHCTENSAEVQILYVAESTSTKPGTNLKKPKSGEHNCSKQMPWKSDSLPSSTKRTWILLGYQGILSEILQQNGGPGVLSIEEQLGENPAHRFESDIKKRYK